MYNTREEVQDAMGVLTLAITQLHQINRDWEDNYPKHNENRLQETMKLVTALGQYWSKRDE